jgi:hypothetical protein
LPRYRIERAGRLKSLEILPKRPIAPDGRRLTGRKHFVHRGFSR